MNVFVTGATGYIGFQVALALRETGHTVTGLARSDKSARKLEDAGMGAVRGGLMDRAALTKAAREADAVIHAASTNDAGAPEADREAVEAILEGIQGTAKPLIYTSGVWVIGETGGRAADETTPLNPTPLVAWRPAQEQRVMSGASHGIVVRPGIVYGLGQGIIAGMVAQAQAAGTVRFVSTGEQHWPVIHVADLAALYVKALTEAPAGSLFLATNDDAPTVREIAQAVSEAAGIPGEIQPWQVEEARQALGPFADALALDQLATSRKARQTLNWEPNAPSVFADLAEATAVH